MKLGENAEFKLYMTEDQLTRLTSQIKYDGFKSIKHWTQVLVRGYIEQNEHLVKFIEEMQGKEEFFPKSVLKKMKAKRKDGKDLSDALGFTDDDLSFIFDEIESSLEDDDFDF